MWWHNRGRLIFMTLRPTWSTNWVPGQPGLHLRLVWSSWDPYFKKPYFCPGVITWMTDSILFWEDCQPIFQYFGSHHQWFWFWFICPERKSRKDGLISFLGAAAIKRLEVSGSFLFTTLGSLLYRSWMLICNTLNKFPSFVFSKGLWGLSCCCCVLHSV